MTQRRSAAAEIHRQLGRAAGGKIKKSNVLIVRKAVGSKGRHLRRHAIDCARLVRGVKNQLCAVRVHQHAVWRGKRSVACSDTHAAQPCQASAAESGAAERSQACGKREIGYQSEIGSGVCAERGDPFAEEEPLRLRARGLVVPGRGRRRRIIRHGADAADRKRVAGELPDQGIADDAADRAVKQHHVGHGSPIAEDATMQRIARRSQRRRNRGRLKGVPLFCGHDLFAAVSAAIFDQTRVAIGNRTRERIAVSAHRDVLRHVRSVERHTVAGKGIGIAGGRFGQSERVAVGRYLLFKAACGTGKGHGIGRSGLCIFKGADANVVDVRRCPVCPAAVVITGCVGAAGEAVIVASLGK